jgi:hypothetical protein
VMILSFRYVLERRKQRNDEADAQAALTAWHAKIQSRDKEENGSGSNSRSWVQGGGLRGNVGDSTGVFELAGSQMVVPEASGEAVADYNSLGVSSLFFIYLTTIRQIKRRQVTSCEHRRGTRRWHPCSGGRLFVLFQLLVPRQIIAAVQRLKKRKALPQANRLQESQWQKQTGPDGQSKRALAGDKKMHDLLIALAFIGMIIAPAIVANLSRVEIKGDRT